MNRSRQTNGRKAPLAELGSPTGSVRLTDLASGAVVRLHRRELSEGESCLLAAMGLTDGCRLVVRSSGDPTIVEVRRARIGLARSVAERLIVLGEVDPSS